MFCNISVENIDCFKSVTSFFNTNHSILCMFHFFVCFFFLL
uniref:Uncharacterized protein n=1 Tax=Anguilla anguilla TaxID=7936 RepID=A0A0E9WS10_ANGAN